MQVCPVVVLVNLKCGEDKHLWLYASERYLLILLKSNTLYLGNTFYVVEKEKIMI
jgi:hypothetical protein